MHAAPVSARNSAGRLSGGPAGWHIRARGATGRAAAGTLVVPALRWPAHKDSRKALIAAAARVTARRSDGIVLVALLALAAALRFVGLPGRGEWNQDQGTELLTLLRWVRDGQMPLVGPLTSLAHVHHGVAFYWILAPAAFLTDANPVAAVITVAVVGVAGVGATWWLGRTVGGPLAGHVAALLMAVSPSAISASTFIWNSNIVAPSSALASAASWYAWRTRHARWWLLAALGLLFMLHGQILAVLAVPPFIALLIADAVRRRPGDRHKLLAPALGATAIVGAGYLPLLLSELHTGFPQTEAIAQYAATAGRTRASSVPLRVPIIIAWRALAWPVSGLAPSAVWLGLPAATISDAALGAAAGDKPGIARQFGCWAAGSIAWAVIALSFVAPSLEVFVPHLPNDHYHCWLDPIVFAAIGVLIKRLSSGGHVLAGRAFAVATVAGCLTLSLASMPPLSSTDGGWPRAAEAAARIRSLTGDHPTALTAVDNSSVAALEFPLRRQGTRIEQPSTARFLVVTCDPTLPVALEAPCGGPAEGARARQLGFPPTHIVDRFAVSPGRTLYVFARS